MSLDIFEKRFSCREFKDEPLKDSDLRAILEAARLSPSSLGLEPWKFFLVTDSAKRAEIAAIAHHQKHVKSAAALIIIVSRLDFASYFEDKLRARGMSEADLKMRLDTYTPFLQGMNAEQKLAYAREQAYIALASILYAAQMLDIGSCAIGGFDKNALDKYLNLDTSKLQSTLIVALGKKASTQIPPKQRFSYDEVVQVL